MRRARGFTPAPTEGHVRKPVVRGFTLVELAISILIGGIALYSLLTIFITSTSKNVDLESLTVALYLANGKLEEVSGQSYENIVSENSTPFDGGFSNFNYETEVDYVAPDDLDTPVLTDQGYKRIVVRVTSGSLASSLEAVTLVTDISNE